MRARFSGIAPLLLITLLCMAGVEGFYWSVDRYIFSLQVPVVAGTPPVSPALPVQQKVPEQKKTNDYSVILQRNLFGPPPGSVRAEQGDAASRLEELEATTLDIVLMGTIKGGGANGRAIILNKKDRKQAIYNKGDVVQGAVIKEIVRGKVVLSVQGKDSVLDMSEAANYVSKSSPTPRPTAVAPVTRQQLRVPAAKQGEAGNQERQIVRPRVVRPTRKISTNPNPDTPQQ